MGIYAKFGIAAVAVVVGTGLFSADTISAAIKGEAAIKARQAAMKDMSADWKIIQDYVKNDRGSAVAVAVKAKEIAETAEQLPLYFPKGSGRGNFSDKQTRALPAIWSDWSGFENASTVMATESRKLVEIAKTGDKKLIADQVAQVNKLGCGGCHKTYRGAKAK